jgi:glycosyltransferase involved in cell wall biosynthesis
MNTESATHSPRFCAVIPAFNEAAYVGGVVKGVVAKGVAVWVVDDGSSDDSAAVAEQAGAQIIRMNGNQGKGAALQAGFTAAIASGFDAILTMDADGQHSPDDVPAFTSAYRQTGIPVLIGNRMADPSGMPWIRRLTNRLMSWVLSRQMRSSIPDTQNGFRLYQASILPLVFPKSYGFAAESEILLNIDLLGLKMDSVPVKTIYGDEKSSIRPVRDTIRFLKMMWKFSRKQTPPAEPRP